MKKNGYTKLVTEGTPHVVMIVANNVTPDTRVKRMAASCAAAGLKVTVIGMQRDGDPREATIGPVRLLRLPVGDQNRRLSEYEKPSKTARSRRRAASRAHYAKAMQRCQMKLNLQNEKHKVRVRKSKNDHRLAMERLISRRACLLSQVEHRDRVVRVATSRLVNLEKSGRSAPFRVHLWFLRRRMRVTRFRARIVRRLLTLRKRMIPREKTPTELAEGRLSRYSPKKTYRVRWRKLLPILHDLDAAFANPVDALEPDVIHAHDMQMIGIAVRVAEARRARGLTTRVVYDAHEYVRGLDTHMPGYLWRAYLEHETEYIGRADRVVTVSDELANRLVRDYELPIIPTVVLNAPVTTGGRSNRDVLTLRDVVKISADVPLLVYSGRVHPSRGVDLLVEALPLLPGVHCALVSDTKYGEVLKSRADRLGVSDRLHVIPYVAPEDVVVHLSDATAGINILRQCGNHEVALPNKLFEYMQAGLPILNADVGISATFVRDLGLGETFLPNDTASFAVAAARLIDRAPKIRQRISEDRALLNRYSWDQQRHALIELYEDLTGIPLEEEAGLIDISEVGRE